MGLTDSKIILCSLLILTACGNHEARDEKPAAKTIVKTATVEEQPVSTTLTLNGRVACDEGLLRKLYIPCTGKVTGIRVEIGDRVRRGQVLATLNSQDAASYHKELRDAESQLRVAERELRTAEDLYASAMLSDRELATAREQVVRLKGEHERLQSVAHINGYQGGAVASITSPINGYVTAKSVYNSCYVDETNNDTPAFEIADLSRVWIVADVYENDLSRIREGAAVTVTTLAWPGEAFHGRIDKACNVFDSESKTMKVRITLPNPDGKLVPGLFANVSVAVASACTTALTVPSASIIFEDGQHYVVLRHDQSYERRPVNILQSNDTITWIAGNLHRGDCVVSQNALLVFEKVKR